MARDPVQLVREYLTAGHQEQSQRNAVVALAQIGDRQSIAELARVASGLHSPEVRALACAEIAKLPPPEREYALEQLREIQRTGDSRRLENALDALVRIGTPESVTELVHWATDSQPDVRRRASETVYKLPQPLLEHATRELRRRIELHPPDANVLTLLKALASRGVATGPLPISLAERFSVANASAQAIYPARGRFQWQSLVTGLVGGSIGLGAGATFIIAVFGNSGRNLELPIYALVAAVVLAAILTVGAIRRVVPYHLHPSPIQAAVTEMYFVLVDALLPVAGLALIAAPIALSISDSAAIGQEIGSLLFAVALTATLPMVVRVGTLIAYGASSNRTLNRVAQTAVGVCLGIIFVTVVLAAISYLLGTSMETSTRAFVMSLWLVLLPPSFGLAYAFAARDTSSGGAKPVVAPAPRLWTRSATLAAAAVCVAVVLVPAGIIIRRSEAATFSIAQLDDQLAWSTSSVPASFQFRVREVADSVALLVVGERSDENFDLVIRLVGLGGDVEMTADDPEEILAPVRPSIYEIQLYRFNTDPPTADWDLGLDVLPTLLALLAGSEMEGGTPAKREPDAGTAFSATVQTVPEILLHADDILSRITGLAKAGAIDSVFEAIDAVATYRGAEILSETALYDACQYRSLAASESAKRALMHCDN